MIIRNLGGLFDGNAAIPIALALLYGAYLIIGRIGWKRLEARPATKSDEAK
jgi:hypothetical protein